MRKLTHSESEIVRSVNELEAGVSADEICRRLNVSRLKELEEENALWANKGALAEQIVGTLLKAGTSPLKPELFYWQQVGSSNAKIDYLVQDNATIVPIEVKAVKSGSMKSLHQFMFAKQLKRAIRFDSNAPSQQEVSVKTQKGEPVEYTLCNYPLYMAELLTQK